MSSGISVFFIQNDNRAFGDRQRACQRTHAASLDDASAPGCALGASSATSTVNRASPQSPRNVHTTGSTDSAKPRSQQPALKTKAAKSEITMSCIAYFQNLSHAQTCAPFCPADHRSRGSQALRRVAVLLMPDRRNTSTCIKTSSSLPKTLANPKPLPLSNHFTRAGFKVEVSRSSSSDQRHLRNQPVSCVWRRSIRGCDR